MHKTSNVLIAKSLFRDSSTIKNSPSVQRFLMNQSLHKYPAFTPEEEREQFTLLKKAKKAGDWQAAHDIKLKIFHHNQRLIVRMAGQMGTNKVVGLDDFVQDGLVNLWKMIDKHNPNRGKLSSFIARRVSGSMHTLFNDNAYTIRPSLAAKASGEIKSQIDAYVAENSYFPSVNDISEICDIPKGQAEQIYLGMLARKTGSISKPLNGSENLTLESSYKSVAFPSPDESTQHDETSDAVNALLGRLDERSQRVITMHFGLDGDFPKELEQIADVLGMTRERARQIKVGALKKLKEITPAHILEPAL